MKLPVFLASLFVSLLAAGSFAAFLTPTNATPAQWVTGWVEDGTDITLPLASLDELSAAQADASTGDFRQCLYAILYQIHGAADNATGDGVFTKMTVQKDTRYDQTTGEAIVTFAVSFRLTNTVSDVVSE